MIERVRPKESFGAKNAVVIFSTRSYRFIDRLRWYCENAAHGKPTVIREEVFHVSDLGTQLKPYIERWMNDETYRTCAECGRVSDSK